MFRSGFEILEQRLSERYYTSVAEFSQDFSRVVGQVLASRDNVDLSSDAGIDNIHAQLLENKPGTAEHMALTQEQKDLKRVAKRVLKPVRELLEEATRKEAQLRGLELEEELRKLDSMGLFASATRELDGDDQEEAVSVNRRRTASDTSAVAGASPDVQDTEMIDTDERTDDAVIHLNVADKDETTPIANSKTAPPSKAASYASSIPDHSSRMRSERPTEPLSPPISRSSSAPNGHGDSTSGDDSNALSDPHDVFAQGGIPWYLEPFDPVGTTIHEERYTGRAVLRDMSEELSDMDEDTLTELAPVGIEDTPNGSAATNGVSQTPARADAIKKANKKKRGRRQHWSR